MTGILFVARLGSTRLSRKHLIEVDGKTFIEWLVGRMHYQFSKEIATEQVKLVICTSDAKENKDFEQIFKDKTVQVFYGDDSNIPLRQLQCADALQLENIISVDGDDILCSPSAARRVFESFSDNTEYVKTIGLPIGLNTSGYARNFLRECLKDNSLTTLETGWGRIFDENKAVVLRLGQYDDKQHLRFTLDYEEDAIFFRKIISGLGAKTVDITDENLISYVESNEINKINQGVNEIYWENFRKNVIKENN